MPRLLLAALCTLGLAVPAAAQFYEPPPPTTKGLVLQAHLNAVGYGYDDIAFANGAPPLDGATFRGGGFGVAAGYGFGNVVTLFAGYDLSLVGGSSDGAFEGDLLLAGTLDLGLRFHVPLARPELVPYGEVALNGFVVLTAEEEGDGSDGIGGGGFTVGGGALYFLSERVALRGGLGVTLGTYSTLFVDGEASDADVEADGANVRLQAGFAFYPFR